MPDFDTKHFGRISVAEDATIEFPGGLPAFERRRQFALLQNPRTAPLIFLQSLEEPGLCFPALPVLAVDPDYHLLVANEDLVRIGLSPNRQPRVGDEVLCLAILSIREQGPTANLLAPIVVNLANCQAVQAIGPESRYSHQCPVVAREAAVCS